MDYADNTNFKFKRNIQYNVDDIARFTSDIVEIQHCFIDESNPVGTSFRILRNIDKIKDSLTKTKYHRIEFNDRMMFCMSVLPTTILVAKYYNMNNKKIKVLKQFLLECFENKYSASTSNVDVYEFQTDTPKIIITQPSNAVPTQKNPTVTISDGEDSDVEEGKSWNRLQTLFDTPTNYNSKQDAEWPDIDDVNIYDL